MTALDKAKHWVEKSCGPDGPKRDWLVTAPIDSYGSSGNRARLLVLQGSPPRGFIIETAHYAIAVSASGEKKKRFYLHE